MKWDSDYWSSKYLIWESTVIVSGLAVIKVALNETRGGSCVSVTVCTHFCLRFFIAYLDEAHTTLFYCLCLIVNSISLETLGNSCIMK